MFKFRPNIQNSVIRASAKLFQFGKVNRSLYSSKNNSNTSNQFSLKQFANVSSHGICTFPSSSTFFKANLNIPSTARFFASSSDKMVKVPPMGDSITEGTVQKWHKKIGDSVQTDDIVATIETDKVNVDIRAPEPGVIKELYGDAGATVRVGADLFKLDASAQPQATPKPAEPKKETAAPKTTAPPKQETPAPAPKPAAPKQETTSPKPAPKEAVTSTVVPGSRTETRVKMSRMRDRISQRLKESQNTYAMLTTFQEADLSNLIAMRDQFKDDFFEKHGAKLGFMSAFVKAAAVALKEQPVINAVLDGSEIIYRDYVDISVAVATPTGLVVPVLRNADTMSFADIEKTIAGLGKKARDGQITIEDMAGGTFTISNGGVYGSMMGTPIINPPQSAILGMHGITKRPVVVNDQIVIRPMMYLALTYDHRLIDGKDAVTFLRKIKFGVEDPRRLLLDV